MCYASNDATNGIIMFVQTKFFIYFCTKMSKMKTKTFTIVIAIIIMVMSIPCTAINENGQFYYFNVQIIDKTLPFPPEKPRIPAQTNDVISAMYDIDTDILQLYFKQELGDVSISIKYSNENIVSDVFYINADDTLTFFFANRNSGEYEIVISTINGKKYIGCFIKD